MIGFIHTFVYMFYHNTTQFLDYPTQWVCAIVEGIIIVRNGSRYQAHSSFVRKPCLTTVYHGRPDFTGPFDEIQTSPEATSAPTRPVTAGKEAFAILRTSSTRDPR